MVPIPADIERIAQISHPVVRNLQITACYQDLSLALTTRTGNTANWCTFATWASRQAGQTIRGEDLRRKLEAVLHIDARVQSIFILLGALARERGTSISLDQVKATTISHLIEQASGRSGDAVARGNKKVFEEIGWQFALFLQTCFQDQAYQEESINSFCLALRAGDPPDGQTYLQQAFRRYYQSLFEPDEKKAAELRFWANIEIGFHEQTRLQPEIAEALNAAAVDPEKLMQILTAILFPGNTVKTTFGFFVQWITGKTNLLRRHVDALSELTGAIIRKTITEHFMTLTFPPGNILLLGKDVIGAYPENLMRLEDPDLARFLVQIDPTESSLLQSGAADWSDLAERLHFICDLFRCYHQQTQLFEPPFTLEQLQLIQAGQVPRLDW
ncbi:MAG TPA: hypothetical protein VK666_04220 [Chryseolinea sp.]|nr:hypothetical protein [Chryseolinea sp.]